MENASLFCPANPHFFKPLLSSSHSDHLSLPTAFAKRNGLYDGSQNIVLMNEEGRSWPSELKKLVSGPIVIVRGWTSFCIANRLRVGDSCTFKLLRNAETPAFQLCSRTKAERKKVSLYKEDNIAERTDANRFVKLTPTLNSLERGKQYLPLSFTSENGLMKPEKITLMDKNGDEWLMELKVDNRSGLMYIISVNGWKSFCAVNEVDAGESLTLELILGGVSPLFKFCSTVEKLPLEPAEARAHKRARVQTCIQETRPKLEIREITAEEEGEPSHRTRASDKTIVNRGNLRETLPSSLPNQLMVNKVKHSVFCALTSIRQFREELETMEQRLEDSLKDIDNLGGDV
ncbi:hypothetical protein Bca4012_022645 [Brassica carinata]